jgi:hypothetical protein
VVSPTQAAVIIPDNSPLVDNNPGSSPVSTGVIDLPLIRLGILLGLFVLAALVLIVVFILRRQHLSSRKASAPPPKTPALIIKRGTLAGTALPLVRFPCRIGSDPHNEVCLRDAHISPAHAEIFADDNGYTLVDLGSQVGTYLNGKPINNQQITLEPGDALRMGGVLMVFGPV